MSEIIPTALDACSRRCQLCIDGEMALGRRSRFEEKSDPLVKGIDVPQ